MEGENVCFYDKFGYCRNGDKCTKIHLTEKCKKEDCDVRKCQRRHPRVCKFFQEKGFCKFKSSCKYDHKQSKNVEVFNSKMDALEKQNELLRSLIIEQNVAINSLIKENSKSIEKLEKKIDTVISMKKNDEFETLLKDVKEIKDFVLNLDFGSEDEGDNDDDKNDERKRLSEVEKEAQGWDSETVQKKVDMFVSVELKHLEEMEIEIQKLRKNNSKDTRIKFRQYCDKMEEEIENCGLVESVHSWHATCAHLVYIMKDFLVKPATKNDKEDALKIIEEYRQKYISVAKQLSESKSTTK